MNYEDRIYHSGYLDGYYASMELYHADDSEMTDEERRIKKILADEEKARRKKRRRNFAIRTAAGLALGGVGAYAYNKAKEAELDAAANRGADDINDWINTLNNTMKKSVTKPRRKVRGFRRNVGSYKVPSTRTYVPTWALERARKHK